MADYMVMKPKAITTKQKWRINRILAENTENIAKDYNCLFIVLAQYRYMNADQISVRLFALICATKVIRNRMHSIIMFLPKWGLSRRKDVCFVGWFVKTEMAKQKRLQRRPDGKHLYRATYNTGDYEMSNDDMKQWKQEKITNDFIKRLHIVLWVSLVKTG